MSQGLSRPKEMLTKKQLQAVINEKLENTLYWLTRAYHLRPEDDQSEQTLLEIMVSLQKMQHDVNQIFTGRSRCEKVTSVQQRRNA